MDAVVRILLRIPNQQALNEILALVPSVHLDCGSPSRERDGTFKLEIYGTAADVEALSKTTYLEEIDDQYGKVLRARRSEVGKGDRFKGGSVKPVGIGVKGVPE